MKYLKIPRTLDFDGLKNFLRDALRLTGLLADGISRKEFRKIYKDVYHSGRV